MLRILGGLFGGHALVTLGVVFRRRRRGRGGLGLLVGRTDEGLGRLALRCRLLVGGNLEVLAQFLREVLGEVAGDDAEGVTEVLA